MTIPADTPVTIPLLVTVATEGSLLIQRPLVGDKVVVAPMQMLLEPVIIPAGVALIVMAEVGAEVHPVVASV